ncbi:hypothetical protein FOXG_14280 [Fusarium oxysporum f. sp. lycopersici 4287]|uniref:5'-deoxynucleotidase n=1 Tax=Fusarium oxysporum f. sp. lycopersici (strain 4287 / CBS 123668 / FGSC 9935 / NRRL 34936) TaxID=426428 RepID=A0A0J9VYR7_FUSO4|nr:hypothetical protein FOXG_14280 [Fusarium oxysporum f. sp. lycopersici 4287]KNB15963.1 hypothetical protein FOXG_14280 [Fusarium oxysporum f. sp. lycopersici 4287]
MDLTFDNEPSELRQVLERLNKIPRTGWLKSGVPLEKCETVGQHTHGVMNIVAELARSRADISPARAADMARCHDYAEVKTGDKTPDEITPEEKKLEEDAAYAEFCSLHRERGEEIRELCVEYRDDKTLTAKLVKDADKFQRLQQANAYREAFPKSNFKRFQQDADLIRDSELKKRAHDTVRAWRSFDLQHLKCIFVIGPPGVATSGDNNLVLIDGFPYDSAQLAGYREIFPVVSGVINFEAPPDVCMSRLRSRAERSGRDDDDESTLRKRLEGYEDRGKTIARQLKEENEKTYHEINADQDKGTVAYDFQTVLHAILPNEMLRAA